MWKHHFKNRFLENKNKNAVHIACPFQKKRKSTFSISWIDVQRKLSFPIPDDRYAWLFSLRNMCTQSSTIFFLFIILCIHLSQMYVSIFVCSLSNFKRKMCLRIDFVSVFFSSHNRSVFGCRLHQKPTTKAQIMRGAKIALHMFKMTLDT